MKKLAAIVLLMLVTPGLAVASDQVRQLIQLIDYIGVDYAGAVAGGRVVDQGEYAEMQDFAAAVVEGLTRLPDPGDRDALLDQGRRLHGLIARRAGAERVRALTAELREGLIGRFGLQVIPLQALDLAGAQRLFARDCAACHGADGRGDGPRASSMDPAPTDFHDRDRYRRRTLFGLYNTITQGVSGTTMPAFAGLSEAQRWSLAFHVGRLATTADERARGEALWQGSGPRLGAEALTTLSPEQAEQRWGGQGAALMAYLRSRPAQVFQGDAAPLNYARERLAESLQAYRSGGRERAYRLAVQAYLEGFELVENALDAVDGGLRHEVEAAMTDYRNQVRAGADVAALEPVYARLRGLLDQADARLGSTALSGSAAFVSAFVILLREGLEALLVVAALAAFLIKTRRRDGLPYLYGGLLGALLAGGLTWLAAATFIDLGGAQRELTEAVAALVAAGVLFYVGFWLHSKTSAAQWRRFIEGSVRKALGRGTLWGLSALAFIAVYREVFETVLFYQALWIQTEPAAQGFIISGLVGAGAMLALLAWLILRYSTRLPLRQFFAATGVFMFALAIVFAGKGVAALQEAGRIAQSPVDLPSIGILGIYPNLQGLAVQGAMLALALAMLFGARLRRRAAYSQSGKQAQLH